MLSRRQRKRNVRVPMARRWAPATECYFPDPEEFNRQLEELRQWAIEQWRLKMADDGGLPDDGSHRPTP